MRLLSEAVVELLNGQARDFTFGLRPWTGPHAVTVEEYCGMAAAWTGALPSFAAGAGAALGGASTDTVDRLRRMGRHLGVACQAARDLLGIWGGPSVTGRRPYEDLLRGRKTLPVVAALAVETPAARRLAGLLSSCAGLDADSARLAAALADENGGRCFTLEHIDHQMALARRAVGDLPLGATLTEELLTLARFLAAPEPPRQPRRGRA
jgi:geranylgeranyl diphosphate synthase type I